MLLKRLQMKKEELFAFAELLSENNPERKDKLPVKHNRGRIQRKSFYSPCRIPEKGKK